MVGDAVGGNSSWLKQVPDILKREREREREHEGHVSEGKLLPMLEL